MCESVLATTHHRGNTHLPWESKNFKGSTIVLSSHRGEYGQDEGLAIIKVPRSMKPPSNKIKIGFREHRVRQGMKKWTRIATRIPRKFLLYLVILNLVRIFLTFWTRPLGEILTILYYNCGYLKTISHYGFQYNQ